MKHLLLLLVITIGIYCLWNMADKKELASGRKFITKHGVRIAALVAAGVMLLAAAYYLPSTNIL